MQHMGESPAICTRVTPDVKARVADLLAAELLSEAVWLRRLIVQELKRAHSPSDFTAVHGRCARQRLPARLNVRLPADDRLLLDERAAARGMASGTYVSWLVRAHLKSQPPLPKAELSTLRRAVAELGAIGRNLNQLARAANSGATPGARDEFKAILKICEALRDHTKDLIKANRASWTHVANQG
jgi:hypothetical protein